MTFVFVLSAHKHRLINVLTDFDYDKNDIKQSSQDFRRDSFDEYGIIYYATMQCAKRYINH